MTKYEKKHLFRFLNLYLGSMTILLLIIAVLIYRFEYKNILESYKYKMQSRAFDLSSKIITAHMQNLKLEFDSLSKEEKTISKHINSSKILYDIAFLDSNKRVLYSNFKVENIDLKKSFYESDRTLFLIDLSSQLHLGVKYIVLRDRSYLDEVSKLFLYISIGFLLSLIFISLIGFFLAKLYLKPIKEHILELDRFIKDTTHELNTPISAILITVQSLKKSDIDSKKLKRVEVSAKRISNIYNDLTYLLFSNKSKKEIESLDIKEAILQRVDSFEGLIESKKLSLELDLESFIFEIDRVSLERLIDNLLSNAIKYNKMRGFIKISLKKRELSIEDSGFGIDRKKKRDIFKRYKRANDFEGGFGIGLNIVNSISIEYKIALSFESKLNRGTVFKLKFT